MEKLKADDAISRIALFNDEGQFRSLDDVERTVLTIALRRYRGNASDIARALQIGRTTLYRRLAHHGISLQPFRLG
jgi:transcriptional regulator of acetoin/glycerol metabolism